MSRSRSSYSVYDESSEEVPRSQLEISQRNAEWPPDQAHIRYLEMGSGAELPKYDYGKLDRIQAALAVSAWPPFQYIRGWVLMDQAALVPSDQWRLAGKLVDMAETSWQDALDNLVHSVTSDLELSKFKAATALAYLPLMRLEIMELAAEPETIAELYNQLVAVAEAAVARYHRVDSRTARLDLSGFIQEITVLALLTRASSRSGVPLLAMPALPRQDAPRPYKRPTLAWDVTVKQLDRPAEHKLQVKTRQLPDDLAKYHPDVTLVYAAAHLANRYDETSNVWFPTTGLLVNEAQALQTGIAPAREVTYQLNQITARLFDLMQRDELTIDLDRIIV